MTLADPSLAGGPSGNQLSAVDHLLSMRLAPLQISPACADGPMPAANRSRQLPRENWRLHSRPADICPPPERCSIVEAKAKSSKLHSWSALLAELAQSARCQPG